MKYKDPVTGEWKTISVKAADTLPIGTIVDYDGTEVPDGWEQVIDPGSYAIFGLASIINWKTHSAWCTLPLTNPERSGGDNFITVENDHFRITSNIKRIRVFANINYQKSVAPLYWLMLGIYHNSTQVEKIVSGGGLLTTSPSAGEWYTMSIETIIDVKKGDIIGISVFKDRDGTIVFNPLKSDTFGDGNACTVLFEVIE